jgi:CDGSH-type Zn-finger protein
MTAARKPPSPSATPARITALAFADKRSLRPGVLDIGEPMNDSEPVVITPYRDGPLIVRGPVRLQDMHGREIAVDRSTIALCRCGKSRMRPLCDGTHKLSRFRAPSELEAG